MTARYLVPIAIPFAIGSIFLAAAAVSFISTVRFLGGAITTQASFAGSLLFKFPYPDHAAISSPPTPPAPLVSF
jgi:hypothetical protein